LNRSGEKIVIDDIEQRLSELEREAEDAKRRGRGEQAGYTVI